MTISDGLTVRVTPRRIRYVALLSVDVNDEAVLIEAGLTRRHGQWTVTSVESRSAELLL